MPYLNLTLILILLLNIAFAFIVVFTQRRNPATTWAWLMVVAVIPFCGFFVYLVLGQDSRKHRVFAEKSRSDEQWADEYLNSPWISPSVQGTEKGGDRMCFPDDAPIKEWGFSHLKDLIHLNHYAGGGMLTTRNRLTLYHDGRTKFDALLTDIKKARRFIFLQYYIMRGDETGRLILRQLTQKAVEGVEVKLLVDGMGCFFTPKKFFKPLMKAGGQVGVFMPPALIRLNYRNHRKLAVIDGTAGYLGGLNIGNEYLGMSKRFGYWRDTHLRITGDAVHPLTLRFLMDWNFSVENKYSGFAYKPRNAQKLALAERYFPAILPNPVPNSIKEETKNGRTKKQSAGNHASKQRVSGRKSSAYGIPVQIVSSGPDTRYPSVMYGYNKMVTEAERSIFIQTPYFVPDESLFGALKVAALSGIDVRIMIPANPDHPFVYWAGLSYLGELLEAGVKCYEYTKGFIHSKTLMIDSRVSAVGTANMDVRSFKMNFECCAFMYDTKVAGELEAAFTNDLKDCHAIRLEEYGKRPRRVKIKESLSRLISPLL